MRLVRGGWLVISAFAVACGDVPGEHHPPNESLTFGELVFRVIRTNLAAAQTCSLEYVSQVEPHHADFVRSVDYALAQDIRNDLPDLLGNTIQPVVATARCPGSWITSVPRCSCSSTTTSIPSARPWRRW